MHDMSSAALDGPPAPARSRFAIAALLGLAELAVMIELPASARAQVCSGTPPPALGTVTAVPGPCPYGVGPVPNTRCRQLEVACAGLDPLVVQLRVTEPDSGVPLRGTVMVGSGGDGGGFYSSQAGAAELFESLAALGFRLVDRAWPQPSGWMTAEGGLRLEACRYATLVTWVRDSMHTQGAFCVTGNSGGSGELAYALTSWGRSDLIDLAVPTGGPPLSRMDYHCGADSTWLSQCPGNVPDDSLDCTPGCLIPPSHPACRQCSGTPTAEQLRWDGVLNPDAVLHYPRTKVHVILGRQDCSSAVPMAMLFYNAITSAKEIQFIPNTPHFVPTSPEGREAIRRAIDLGTRPTVAVGPEPRSPALASVVASPNPFQGRVAFDVFLASRGRVGLQIFDLAGRRVATLLDEERDAGGHRVVFEPEDGIPQGVLFYRLRTESGVLHGTLVRRR